MFRLIIDTETCGSLNHPLVYDFGGVVVDSDFNIIDSFDYVIRDIFFERRADGNGLLCRKITVLFYGYC